MFQLILFGFYDDQSCGRRLGQNLHAPLCQRVENLQEFIGSWKLKIIDRVQKTRLRLKSDG